jgi:hypothetical protein
MLVCLRKYLEWLWEQGTLAAPGQELLLSSDLPKKPEYRAPQSTCLVLYRPTPTASSSGGYPRTRPRSRPASW